jgi:hypothetical protein
MTVVWGAAFVVQAAISAAIIESTSTDKAFLINKILPYLFLAVLGAWTFLYGVRAKRRGEAAARSARTRALSEPQDGQPR